ncbi:carbamoyl phosphate synthase small subunit [Pediococcus argentinicus]|uniref:Carbamoyl phosphate synthase small chain n=1 Tax=Pediococcus argentinicus TaxID=480391 RepID=A0A0R2NKR1_9LACO|nr:carbamoyl phosphate synthase small subunit [Pediococcus argentinicus]KRO26328.1 carbamoyl-phosphate synthase, small subunit [Pediococcus argentinicus]NKZ21480.1 carbamoyl phosphate synthase small subunit [Pediococcus argentinicus]GEP18721.1 carbamoyl-phosphate synthase small chain [Pediococcus argentinicus]
MAERYLILEDGSVFKGTAFGSRATTFGEVVFNTSMTGYQQIITNQIYHNQIIVFSQPTIGGAGIERASYESVDPTCKGVIVRDVANVSINRRRRLSLDEYLKSQNIPGITGIDTRALIRKLRQTGTIKGSIIDPVNDLEHAFDQLKAIVLTNQQVNQVSTPKPFPNPGSGKNVVVVDLGLKYGILRQLNKRNCNVTVLPYSATADEIFNLDPDGVIISTGPGNPNDLPESLIAMVQEVERKIPLFAIGLGHEVFAVANGCEVTELAAEHHGNNHPILSVITDEIMYASQGQGYSVKRGTVDRNELMVTHYDMVDGSIQGLRHRDYPAFSVQFFPDSYPGPYEVTELFDEFSEMMTTRGR